MVILDVTGTPSLYAQGTWPRDAMHDAPWMLALTGTAASSSSGTHVIASNGNQSGLWYIDGDLQLYDSANSLVLSEAVSWSTSSVVEITIDHPSREVTVAGADSGDGTYGYSTSNDLWQDSQLDVGASPGEIGGAFQLVDIATVGDFESIEDDAVDLTLQTASGTAHDPSALSVQPVSLPLATALATVLALTASPVQPVSLGVLQASAAAHAPEQSIALPALEASAQALALAAGEVQPVGLALASGAGDALSLAAGAVQPVTLQVVTADGQAHAVELPPAVQLAVAAAIAWALPFAPSGTGVGVAGMRSRGRRFRR